MSSPPSSPRKQAAAPTSPRSSPRKKKGVTTGNESDAESPVVAAVLPLTDTDAPMPQVTSPTGKATRARTAAAAAAAAETAAAAATASSESSVSKKRKLLSFGSVVHAAMGAHSGESHEQRIKNAAAARIQALIRGAKARSAHKKATLWKAWNELDWKEEQALMNSHSAYEALKKAVTNRVKHDAESADEDEEDDEEEEQKTSKKGRKRAVSPSPKKRKSKGRRKSISAEDEESACGLLLRDQDPITFTWVQTLMEHFRQNKQLPQSLVYKLLARAEPLLKSLPNIVDVQCTGRLTVVGDLHGQLDDLLAIFKLTGYPSPRSKYIFNGDFVDRGQHSVECILTLLAWKILMPNDVMLNRGNHEARDINGRDGFERECLQKYSNNVDIFDGFSRVFAMLPIVHLIDSQVYVTHGGLFPTNPSLEEIQELDRFHEVPPSGSLLEYALWSDPKPGKGRSESPRGAGLLWGPEVTNAFLKKNNLKLIVRSHECMSKGYKHHHSDKVITVFSASNYCGTVGNDGALVVFERDGETSLVKPDKPAAAATPAADAPPPPLRSARLAAKELALPPMPAKEAGVELKRRIFTFYAAKKEKQSAYRVVGGSNMESDIIAKLMHIISEHRLHLTDYWFKHSQQHSTGVRTVTRAQWAQGLKTVLGLSIPFLEFTDLLGLPKLGVDGKPRGSIDFLAFLARFRPVNLVVLKAQQRARDELTRSLSQGDSQTQPSQDTQEPPSDGAVVDDDAALQTVQTILELLHKNRFELESLFRYLDYDGDEAVDYSEFREGLKALEGQLGMKFTDAQLESLTKFIDTDGDGKISYSEFLGSFEIPDPTLKNHLVRSESIRQGRTGPSGLAVRTDGSHAMITSMDAPPTNDEADEILSLSPQHADDASPPRDSDADTDSLNDLSDHDETSTSHMAGSEGEAGRAKRQKRE